MTDGYDRILEIQRLRDSVPLPARVGDLYSNGSLRPEYLSHTRATAVIQRLHRRAGEAVSDNNLPVGVQQALKLPLVWVQIVKRHPWKVMWVRYDSEGRKRKGEVLCATLGGAIKQQRRIARVAPNATIVSRARGYDIPPELRGKLPPGWFWCPHCMKPRRYKRDPQNRKFHVMKKVPSDDRRGYKWVARQVYLLFCPMCYNTNRNQVYRRSNQPWEIRTFKKGATRARRNHNSGRTQRRKRGKSAGT